MRVNDLIHMSASPVLLAVLATIGFLSHLARPRIRELGSAWSELTSYAVGSLLVLFTFPVVLMHVDSLVRDDDEPAKRNVIVAFLSLCMTYGAIGMGVVAGWLYRPD